MSDKEKKGESLPETEPQKEPKIEPKKSSPFPLEPQEVVNVLKGESESKLIKMVNPNRFKIEFKDAPKNVEDVHIVLNKYTMDLRDAFENNAMPKMFVEFFVHGKKYVSTL